MHQLMSGLIILSLHHWASQLSLQSARKMQQLYICWEQISCLSNVALPLLLWLQWHSCMIWLNIEDFAENVTIYRSQMETDLLSNDWDQIWSPGCIHFSGLRLMPLPHHRLHSLPLLATLTQPISPGDVFMKHHNATNVDNVVTSVWKAWTINYSYPMW